MGEKNYYVEKIETPEEVIKQTNGKIALNVIFAIAGFILAGVGFGIGEEMFNSSALPSAVFFGGVGISCGSIHALRDNLKIKSSAKEKIKTKGSK